MIYSKTTNEDSTVLKGLSHESPPFSPRRRIRLRGLRFPRCCPLLDSQPATAPATWRTFEVTTRVEMLKPSGVTRSGSLPRLRGNSIPENAQPTPSTPKAAPQKSSKANPTPSASSRPNSLKALNLFSLLQAASPPETTPSKSPRLASPATPAQKTPADLDYFLRPTKLIPTDGIVKAKPTKSPERARTPTSKKPAPSTNGSSTTPPAIPKRAAAAPATSGSCSKPAT